jgi:hypothetical protein
MGTRPVFASISMIQDLISWTILDVEDRREIARLEVDVLGEDVGLLGARMLGAEELVGAADEPRLLHALPVPVELRVEIRRAVVHASHGEAHAARGDVLPVDLSLLVRDVDRAPACRGRREPRGPRGPGRSSRRAGGTRAFFSLRSVAHGE